MNEAKQMELEKKIDSLMSSNERILSILENDTRINKKGLVSRVDIVESEVSEIKAKDRVRVGKAGLVGGLISVIMIWVGKIILRLM